MCGICGIIGESNESFVREMLSAIQHRGPDSSLIYSSSHYSCAVARLALVDEQASDQPLVSGDGFLCFLFNGEIYNYRELSGSSKDPSKSEIQAIAELYKRSSVGFISELEGMFAVAIIDGDRLILARDRFGIKPLFYYIDGRSILFASEIKALLRYPTLVPELNVNALEETAVFGFMCDQRTTPFKNIFQVEPGTVVTFENGHLTIERYASLPNTTFGSSVAADTNLAREETKRLIRDSLSTMLNHGKDEKGFYLSGGIDSSLLALLAADFSINPIKTFTLSDSADSEDLHAARKVANAIGSEHSEFKIGFDEYIRALPDYIHHYENLIAGGVFDIHGGVAFHILSKFISEHVRVAFSGEGADELFGGYYWSYLHPLGLSDRIRERKERISSNGHIECLVDSIFPQPEDEKKYQKNIFELLMTKGLSNYHLWSVDRSAGAFGFEIRPAYLFDPLAKFVLNLPIDFKVDKGQTKIILREIARDIFNQKGLSEIVTRQKIGMPAAVKYVGDEIEAFAEKIYMRNLARRPYGNYLTSPIEALMFDIFFWIFIKQRGILPSDFQLNDFFEERLHESLYS